MIGTAEAMNLGVKLGLDPKLLTDVVNISTGRSWSSDTYNPVPGVMENVPAAKDYDGGFSVELIAKDLGMLVGSIKKSTLNQDCNLLNKSVIIFFEGLAGDAALSISAPIPLAAMSHQLFRTMITYGLGKKDFSVIYKFLEGAAVKK